MIIAARMAIPAPNSSVSVRAKAIPSIRHSKEIQSRRIQATISTGQN